MPLAEIVRYAVAVALTGVLAWASYSDIKDRRIPNLSVLAVIALFAVWAISNGGESLLSAVYAAGIAFAISIALYLFKIVGAGDSKLFTAVALFAGMGYLGYMGVATALAGGVIAAISLASRPQRAMVMFSLRGKGDYGRGVPYGVAIAIGASLVVWGALLGLLHPYGSPGALSVDDINAALHQ